MSTANPTADAPDDDAVPVGGDHRPTYHYTAERHFLNDPNGLVRHDGVWHMYYQYNPLGNVHGDTSWGHATSTDLVHWAEQPLAISCDEAEDVWSGSVVSDLDDTSGFGRPDQPALVAVYTSRRRADEVQCQSLAYSLDSGTTWTKYAENPVLDIGSTQFRDPKVFWDEARERWTMVVALAAEHQVSIYTSSDLRTWTHRSDHGPAGRVDDVWECPDLFPLPEQGRTRWVMTVAVGGRVQYSVGDFDGARFIATVTGVMDHGADYYAAVTYNGAPDGRRLMVGWMSRWEYAQDTPTGDWRGAMSVTRELSLTTLNGRPTLLQTPVPLEPLGLGRTRVGSRVFAGTSPVHARGTAYRLEASLAPHSAEDFGVDVLVGGSQRTRIGYDLTRGQLYVDRTRSGESGFSDTFAAIHRVRLDLHGRPLELTVLVDACSVEVFANAGLVSITDLVFPDPTSDGIELFSEGGPTRLERMEIIHLGAAVTRARSD